MKMKTTLALDVYGTLIDPTAVFVLLKSYLGREAQSALELWRRTQLEYSFRRGLMAAYVDFSVITSEALDQTCRQLDLGLTEGQKAALLDMYRSLPAYDSVIDSLEMLWGKVRLYAFSNGKPDDLKNLMAHAGIDGMLDGIVSVDPVRSFKPDPRVYRHFLQVTGSNPENTWLVSGNAFDILGAQHASMKTAWLRRHNSQILDGWGRPPDAIIGSFSELLEVM